MTMEIDGWTIDAEMFWARGPYDASGYRRTIPLLVKTDVDGRIAGDRERALREALKEALDRACPNSG